MRRLAAPGEWRANLQQGGRGEAFRLPDATARLAVDAAAVLGLDYAGVDLIEGESGPLILELNASPGWLGLQSVTGCDVAASLIAYVVARLDRR